MAKDTDVNNMLGRIDDKLDDVQETVYKIDKEVALQKAAFDEHMKQDEKMYEEFRRMNDILQQNTDSLKEHMYRTEIAERQLQILEDLAQKMDLRLEPIEQERLEYVAINKWRNDKMKKIGKILGIIATLVAIAVSVKSL